MQLIRLRFFVVLVLLLCSLFQVSCEYVPEGENISKIQPPVQEPITISLDLEKDTVILLGGKNLTLSLNTGSYRIWQITIFLDNRGIKVLSNSSTNTFELNPSWDFITSGTHKLKAVIQTFTNSNSLSENFGNEIFTFEKEWTLIYDNLPPSPSRIINVSKQNGSVRIDWEKYQRVNFKSYTLGVSISYANVKLSEVIDQNQTSTFDQSYVGGDVTYLLTTSAVNNSTTATDAHTFNGGSIPTFYSPIVSSDSVILKWSKCLFQNNFKEYDLTSEAYGHKELFRSSNINDTFFVYRNAPFCKDESYAIRTNAIKNIKPNLNQIRAKVGEPFTSFYVFKPISNNIVSISWSNKISLYNLDEKKIINTKPANPRYDVIFNSLYLFYTNTNNIVKLKTDDLSTVETYSLPTKITDSYYLNTINVSSSGIAFLNCQNKQTGLYNSLIYDLNLHDTISFFGSKQHQLQGLYSNVSFSKNGNLFAVKNNNILFLYKVEGNLLQLISSNSVNGYVIFDPENNDQIIQLYNNQVKFMYVSDLSEVRSFYTEKSIEDYPNIDIVNYNIGFSNNTSKIIQIYSLRDGNKVREINYFSEYPDFPITLFNNYIFSQRYSKMLKIK